MKKGRNFLKIGKKDFYIAMVLMSVVMVCLAYTGSLLAINLAFFPNPQSKQSSSIEIKEIVANITSCCYTSIGCIDYNYTTSDNKSIVVRIDGEYCAAKELYKWVDDNINYTHQSGYLNADDTLKIRSADCADLSILYCSLAEQAIIECKYIETQDHMFNYLILKDQSVIIVDLANHAFQRLYNT